MSKEFVDAFNSGDAHAILRELEGELVAFTSTGFVYSESASCLCRCLSGKAAISPQVLCKQVEERSFDICCVLANNDYKHRFPWISNWWSYEFGRVIIACVHELRSSVTAEPEQKLEKANEVLHGALKLLVDARTLPLVRKLYLPSIALDVLRCQELRESALLSLRLSECEEQSMATPENHRLRQEAALKDLIALVYSIASCPGDPLATVAQKVLFDASKSTQIRIIITTLAPSGNPWDLPATD